AGLLGLLGFLGLPARLVLYVALDELDSTRRAFVAAVGGIGAQARPLAGRALRRHHGCTSAALVLSCAFGCGVGIVAFVAHRMLLRSIFVFWCHVPVSTIPRANPPSAGATGLEPATCGFGD